MTYQGLNDSSLLDRKLFSLQISVSGRKYFPHGLKLIDIVDFVVLGSSQYRPSKSDMAFASVHALRSCLC